MKIKVEVGKNGAANIVKEIALPYYAKNKLMNQYTCIASPDKIITVFNCRGYNRISLDTDKGSMKECLSEDYVPVPPKEFTGVMEKTIKSINAGMADFVGIETSLLP